ncbi:hypothetical protein RJ640_005469 [Escallonia rubra]|uniref:Uncharacterized protein n=1 Tax=Escallonia rubra TaxID=112253 RepID=A0AA88RRQ8_9ASTE|nr:hypothetical protein RJ640_005469 [Escallonia rubra]
MGVRGSTESDGGDFGVDDEDASTGIVLGGILGQAEDCAADEAALLVHHQPLDRGVKAEELGELVVGAKHVNAGGGVEDEILFFMCDFTHLCAIKGSSSCYEVCACCFFIISSQYMAMANKNTGLLVCLLIVIMDIVAGILGIAAEVAQNKVQHLRLWILECRDPSYEAFKLGMAAVVLLALAHVITNLLGGCICIWSTEELDKASPNKRLAVGSLILSWYSLFFC